MVCRCEGTRGLKEASLHDVCVKRAVMLGRRGRRVMQPEEESHEGRLSVSLP